MQTSNETTARVREHFRKKAFSFDHLYDEENALQKLIRPGLFRRREFALAVAREYEAPAVLDVGCGSARIGELALEQGAARYVGIDLSDTMLELARTRLDRFEDKSELIQGDFLAADLDRSFDVVLALGLFDYLADPKPFVHRMYALSADGGSTIGSFPRWHWLKGPVRKVRYEVINNCPIFNYTPESVRALFGGAGFSRIDLHAPGNAGFLVRAVR
jgi:SAM-dependent methyltransferase